MEQRAEDAPTVILMARTPGAYTRDMKIDRVDITETPLSSYEDRQFLIRVYDGRMRMWIYPHHTHVCSQLARSCCQSSR
eukprot:COSAG01_NODE_7069_length_3368_cov_4.549709_3_plen_79_part_00